jgi:hypothetical protein
MCTIKKNIKAGTLNITLISAGPINNLNKIINIIIRLIIKPTFGDKSIIYIYMIGIDK